MRTRKRILSNPKRTGPLLCNTMDGWITQSISKDIKWRDNWRTGAVSEVYL